MSSKAKMDAVELEKRETYNNVMQAFLSGKNPREIAEEFDLLERDVRNYLGQVSEEVMHRSADLAEKITLINIARTQQLIKVLMPLAMDGQYNAIKMVLDVMKFQEKLSESVQPDEIRGDDQIIYADRIERTMTSSSPLYDTAQAEMEEEWLEYAEIPVEEIYASDDSLEDMGREDLQKLSNKVDELLGEREDDEESVGDSEEMD